PFPPLSCSSSPVLPRPPSPPPFPYTTLFRSKLTVVSPAPFNVPAVPIRLLPVTTSLVPCVIVKLAVPTTNPNAFKLTLPLTCNADRKSTRLNSIHQICSYPVSSSKQNHLPTP